MIRVVLVVKKTISKPEDLIGKRIAVPFISTTPVSYTHLDVYKRQALTRSRIP